MCLIVSKRARGRIARRDIPCLKVICKANGHVGWVTPYQYTRVTPGLVTSELISENDAKYSGEQRIEVGIHSFVSSVDQAILNYEIKWFSVRRNDVKVVECIIPKGARYYLGDFDGNKRCSYASDQLIYPIIE